MRKLEKRIVKNKISRFFKTTPLLIFLHCIDRKNFYEKLNKTLITNQFLLSKAEAEPLLSKTLLAKAEKEVALNLAEIKKSIALEGLKIKLVKNSYVRKTLTPCFDYQTGFVRRQSHRIKTLKTHSKAKINTINACASHSESGTTKSHETSLQPKVGQLTSSVVASQSKAMAKQHPTVQSLTSLLSNTVKNQPTKEGASSLLKASYIWLGLKNVNSLAKIKNFIEDQNIVILGAVYEHENVISDNQIKRLAFLVDDGTANAKQSQNKQLYINFITTLKKHISAPQNQIAKALGFRYLFQHQSNLLSLCSCCAALKCNR